MGFKEKLTISPIKNSFYGSSKRKVMCAEITIKTPKQLDIYMNPQRQRLLRCMELEGRAMTAKQLSDYLGISPSAVSFHLKKLEGLGLVALDHTELIHGICAKYYCRLPVVVNLGGDANDNLKAERELLTEYLFHETWDGFRRYIKSLEGKQPASATTGDMINSVVYLTDREAEQIKKMLLDFHRTHIENRDQARPWQIAVIAYPVQNEKGGVHPNTLRKQTN